MLAACEFWFSIDLSTHLVSCGHNSLVLSSGVKCFKERAICL